MARAKKQTVGDPFDMKTKQGPQVDQEQFDKVMGYIEGGKRGKANLLAAAAGSAEKGYFIEPTVFADVQDDMKIAQEEIFGPVMSIFKFQDIKEVIERANKSLYGLAAAVWTKDIAKAYGCRWRASRHGVDQLLRRVRRGSAVRRIQTAASAANWANMGCELHGGEDGDGEAVGERVAGSGLVRTGHSCPDAMVGILRERRVQDHSTFKMR